MRFKRGVVVYDLNPRFEAKLSRIDDVHRRVVGREAIMTSCRDGKHSKGSRHYTGEAADFRTRDLSPRKKKELRDALAIEAGPDCDVVKESTHIHVELDS